MSPATATKAKTQDSAVKILKSLANPTRLELVHKLVDCPGGENWGDLCAKALLSQPTMSHHLIKLVEAGVISEQKVGNQKNYRLNRQLLERRGININKLIKESRA